MVTARYNPRQHITARQLRDIGFLLCENIPDEAFVSRLAVDLDACEDLDDGTSRLGLQLLESFAGMQTPVYEDAVA